MLAARRFAALLFASCLATASAGAQVIAFTEAMVVDGSGAPARPATVIVENGRITAVNPPDAPVPNGARMIRAAGHTLTPGFFDLHTHLPYSAVAGLYGDWSKVLAAYLYCGVTSVADFGTYPETFEPMRRLLREGVVTGPRIHLAARMTTPGGHGAEAGRGDFFSLEVLTPEEARAATRRLLAYQPDAIKVFTDGWRYGAAADMTSMEEATLAAIVKEAHAAGVEVMTHTVTLARAKIAARAGVDVIAHGIGDAIADNEFIELAKKNGTTYVSTLAVYETRREALSPLVRTILEPMALAILDRRTGPNTRPTAGRMRRWGNLMGNVGLLQASGVALGAGTDAGVTGTLHGWSSLREMELLAAGGLSPLEAVTAATGASARAIKVDGERGTIAPGKLADLVLIEGEPHRDIHDVEKVRRVWLGGKEVDRAALARLIASPDPAPLPARKAAALIDDMEQPRTSIGTLRVNATDADHDHSKMLFQRTRRNPAGGYALSVQAAMSEKSRPFGQVWLPLSPGGVEPVDASAFTGIEFEVRGEGAYNVLFHRRSVRDGKYPSAPFQATAAWTTVRVPLPPSPTDLQVIAFELARPAGEQAWLELDNVRFHK